MHNVHFSIFVSKKLIFYRLVWTFNLCKTTQNMIYRFTEPEEGKITFEWSGSFTRGWICPYTKKVRIWFKEPAARSYQYKYVWECPDDSFCKELNSNGIVFPGDDFNICTYSLSKIIDDMTTEKSIHNICQFYENINDALHDEYEHDGLEDNTDEEYCVLVTLFPTHNLWIIYDKDKIINELKNVLIERQKKEYEWSDDD